MSQLSEDVMTAAEASGQPHVSRSSRSDSTIAQALLAEFEQELKTTRKFLERILDDTLAWKPHEKSLTAGQLALHIATLPGGVLEMASRPHMPVPNVAFAQPATGKEILAALEASAGAVRSGLPAMSDARMHETFSIMNGDAVVLAMPRAAFLRAILFNHWYHHRGQLGVYLRLVGAKVPSAYGPSGDEAPF